MDKLCQTHFHQISGKTVCRRSSPDCHIDVGGGMLSHDLSSFLCSVASMILFSGTKHAQLGKSSLIKAYVRFI